MDKYHVALSFAGEDRAYVEAVAKVLRKAGVRVFYDDFEDTTLWGKDLYVYLTEVYQQRAMYTVMFVSKAYKDKLWTNRERQAAQARAFTESKEYILPAYFDRSIEIPGMLKTTGHIDLKKLAPEEFAQKILQKLRADKVFLIQEKFAYSSEAKADIDFPLSDGSEVSKIITALRSYDWYTQNPAIERLFSLGWPDISKDQAFVLGRNVYQAACGNSRGAIALLKDLRRELAKLPQGPAEHLLNGMMYEAYFDSKGEFRGEKLKSERLADLFAMQTAEKYQECIAFISQALGPFRSRLAAIPNPTPQVVEIDLKISSKAPRVIKSLICFERELLVKVPEKTPTLGQLWKLSFKEFTVSELKDLLAEAWGLPVGQLSVTGTPKLAANAELSLPEGTTIKHPGA